MERKLNLVLFGPPGAGKGTQSENLINKYNLVHLSTGDLLRSEISQGTELGKQARAIMDRGELVSDEIVIGMIESRIDENPNANGFIFDGFPRTTGQAVALDDLLQKKGTGISAMLALEVNDEELLKRLLLRGRDSGRADDQNEDIIRRRIEEYNNKTLPLKEYYSEQGKFHSIQGIGSVEEIFRSLVDRITFLKAEMELTSLETDLEHMDLTIQDFEVADDIAPELLLEIDAIKRAEAEEEEEKRELEKERRKSLKKQTIATANAKQPVRKTTGRKTATKKTTAKKKSLKKSPAKKNVTVKKRITTRGKVKKAAKKRALVKKAVVKKSPSAKKTRIVKKAAPGKKAVKPAGRKAGKKSRPAVKRTMKKPASRKAAVKRKALKTRG